MFNGFTCCLLFFLKAGVLFVLAIVIPNDVQTRKIPIIKLIIILCFFYITIRKIQQKYQKTKNSRIITRDSLYSTKIKTLVETRVLLARND